MEGGQRQVGQESCGCDRVISSIIAQPLQHGGRCEGARWSWELAEALKVLVSRCGGTVRSDTA
ncbi:hypothetical protein Mal65_37420 [Crateriforma conspicua]|nr:hypothetical protein Mal65_37420 [Crateriforma conspicua]